MIIQLDTENADRNLTSEVTVLTHTPSATLPCQCQALVCLGDGSKDLDGTGGNFEFALTIGSQVAQADPTTVAFSTDIRACWWSPVFPVPANAEVVVKAKSPNGADSDVDVTAYLFAVSSVNAAYISEDATAADNCELDYDGTGYDKANSTIGTATAITTKTGFALASDGLDSVATTQPSGVASNFREMMVQLWRRAFKKATMTSSELKCYADDGTTVHTTQAISDAAGTETQGAAS